jgi:hypothetical protein
MYAPNLKALLWTVAVSVAKDVSKDIAKNRFETHEFISDRLTTSQNYVGNTKHKVDDCSCTLSIFVKLRPDSTAPSKQFLLEFFAVPESKGLIHLEPMLKTAAWHQTYAIQFANLAQYRDVAGIVVEQLMLNKILVKS